ncbi:MAG: pitrilysin family protein, partial [Pseudomonadota bacterium]
MYVIPGRMEWVSRFWCGVFAIATLFAVQIQTASAEPSSDWAPETFSLDNGMQVVVLPDHRVPVVTHMVWYRVGAVDEAPGKSGIAHFFEHLMFKATDEIPAGEFSKIVARNGGQDNAFTSQDYTAYFQRVAKDRLPMMMRMEADRMTDLQLTDEEVLPERDVVKEERRQRTDNNPGALLWEKTAAALYQDHPYGVPIIGFMDEVEELTREDALDFYAQWYGPENAVLIVAGDITVEELRPLAEEIYGVIAPKGDLAERAIPEVEPLPASVDVEHVDPKVRQPSFSRYWQGVSVADDDADALSVAMELLGGGRTSRFQRALVEEQGVAVSAYAFSSSDSIATGMIGVGATPA